VVLETGTFSSTVSWLRIRLPDVVIAVGIVSPSK
jgi:hypothetical protein